MNTKYRAELVNVQGCVFDTWHFNNIKKIKKWARNRGKCKLNVYIMIDFETHLFKSYDIKR